ncbi:bifunctional isocitrate dehydrogenase kinase/phosphatase [Chitinibacteraceae bacterium HSL-7]
MEDNVQRMAGRLAELLLAGFNRHYQRFSTLNRTALTLFEAGDVPALRCAVRDRIAFYDERVALTADQLAVEFDIASIPDQAWMQAKTRYIQLLVAHKQPELAETFFNSVVCRLLHRSYFNNDFIFYRPAASTEYIEAEALPTYRAYYPSRDGLLATIRRVLDDAGFALPFENRRRDVVRIARAMKLHLGGWPAWSFNAQVKVLSTPFFRGNTAYLIGTAHNGELEQPFALALMRSETGALYVDAALFDRGQIRHLFSLSRAYFMVDMEVPSAHVRFLQKMMPDVSRAELYTMLGLGKQGKTMFYRELMHHLKNSSDQFQFAPGIKGLVMIVFTLPSYPFVFKIIKDVIPPPKDVTRATVRQKYLMVKQHDRVGRMADSLEFSNVALPIDRFDPAVLDEIRRLAPSMLEAEGDTVVIRHLYIERRMKPLNLVLDSATPEVVDTVIRDYGAALRELAIANIFPGDMLFKNFGVTRLGRVVFYDYDEIEYMTDCTFRRIPPPMAPEYELSGEAWYTGYRNEVYPEEFAAFLLARDEVKAAFLKYHADLLTPEFWQNAKARIEAGTIEAYYPYPAAVRFARPALPAVR